MSSRKEKAGFELASNAPDTAVRIFKALGVVDAEIKDGKLHMPCTGRPGILYVKGLDGTKTPLCYNNPERTDPRVCACEHEAFDLIAGWYKEHVILIALARLSNPDNARFPKPEDFCYAYSYEAEEKTEVSATEGADAVIDFIKKL